MQPNEFIPGFVLLATLYGGWRLIRFARSRSKPSKIAGYIFGAGILALSGCLVLLYGCAIAYRYRSAPSYSPDGKHIAQITELDSGAMDRFHTTVEVRSRWQIYPETVFASNGAPREVEAKWLSNSELVIRYASGFPPNRDHPLLCSQQYKQLRITCEPVDGYSLRPK